MAIAPMTIKQRRRAQGLDPSPRYPKRNTDAKRFRGSPRWKTVRKLARSRMPFCVDPFGVHETLGRVEWTEDIHHIQSVTSRPDLACAMDNLAGLCRMCHARISGMERAGHDTTYLFECLRGVTQCQEG